MGIVASAAIHIAVGGIDVEYVASGEAAAEGVLGNDVLPVPSVAFLAVVMIVPIWGPLDVAIHVDHIFVAIFIDIDIGGLIGGLQAVIADFMMIIDEVGQLAFEGGARQSPIDGRIIRNGGDVGGTG